MDRLLSLVIPVYNEVASLEPLLAEIDAAVAGLGVAYEVVFVDDGSTDGIVRRDGAPRRRRASDVRIVKLRRNFGKSAALAHGFAAVRGDVIVTLDGDRQDDPAEIGKLIAKLDEGFDLVSGWKQAVRTPPTKTLPSRFFNWTVRRTTGHPAARLQLRLQGVSPRGRGFGRRLRRAAPLHPGGRRAEGFRVTEVAGRPPATHRRASPSTAGSASPAATSTCSPSSSSGATTAGRSTSSAGSGACSSSPASSSASTSPSTSSPSGTRSATDRCSCSACCS